MRFLGKPHLEGWVDPNSTAGWKPLCMLAYLCVNLPLRLHTDTELAQLLWPDLPLKRAQRRVDEAAELLNRMGRDRIIECTRFGEYGVIKPAVSVDVWIFRGGVRMRRHEDALSLYRGELLEGLNLPDAPEFMAWLGRQRKKYQRLATVCAWRAHERAKGNDEPHLAAGLAVLAYRTSSDPAPLLPRVISSLEAAGAQDQANRLLDELDADSDHAGPLERARRTPGHPATNRRGVPAVSVVGRSSIPRLGAVVLVAVLLLAAVIGVPRLAPGSEESPNGSRDLGPARESDPEAGVDGLGASPLGDSALEGETAGLPPSPESIWDLANRHMATGAFADAEALFRLLLEHPRLGEAATTRGLMAWSASRSSLFPPWTRSGGSNAAHAAAAMAGLRHGHLDRSHAPLPSLGPASGGLDWLAYIYRATYSGGDSLVALVEGAPDTVFTPSEGPLSKHQFLAWAYEAAGDSQRAFDAYRRAEAEARAALEADPGDPWAHRALALSLMGLGDSTGAHASLEVAEDSGESDREALLRYKLLEARALLTPSGSEARRLLIDSLLEARYPWPLDSLQLAMDPRWQTPPGTTTAPPDPSR